MYEKVVNARGFTIFKGFPSVAFHKLYYIKIWRP